MRPTTSFLRSALVPCTVGALILAGGFTSGCRRQTQIPQTLLVEANDTPEGQLRNVMRRLEDALTRARPASDSGVTSRRHCSYELFEPTEEGGPYRRTFASYTTCEWPRRC